MARVSPAPPWRTTLLIVLYCLLNPGNCAVNASAVAPAQVAILRAFVPLDRLVVLATVVAFGILIDWNAKYPTADARIIITIMATLKLREVADFKRYRKGTAHKLYLKCHRLERVAHIFFGHEEVRRPKIDQLLKGEDYCVTETRPAMLPVCTLNPRTCIRIGSIL